MPISIGIPVYNAELYLADAIRSVFAQTYQDWELILIDDGSKDRSLDIAYAVSDPRVRVISDGVNRKLPYRLNQIIAESKYDFIARMDADDLMSPDRLQRQLDILLSDRQIDVVSTGVCSLSNDNQPVGKRVYANKQSLSLKEMLNGQSGVVHASILARKSWCERNPYDVKQMLTEDYELWIRAFLNDDFHVRLIEEPLYYYREEGNVTAVKLLRAYASQRAIIKAHLSNHSSKSDVLAVLVSLHVKSLVVKSLSIFNMLGLLHQRRGGLALDHAVLEDFNREIAIITNTKVPGLN